MPQAYQSFQNYKHLPNRSFMFLLRSNVGLIRSGHPGIQLQDNFLSHCRDCTWCKSTVQLALQGAFLQRAFLLHCRTTEIHTRQTGRSPGRLSSRPECQHDNFFPVDSIQRWDFCINISCTLLACNEGVPCKGLWPTPSECRCQGPRKDRKILSIEPVIEWWNRSSCVNLRIWRTIPVARTKRVRMPVSNRLLPVTPL